jgi:hypothetical protein
MGMLDMEHGKSEQEKQSMPDFNETDSMVSFKRAGKLNLPLVFS